MRRAAKGGLAVLVVGIAVLVATAVVSSGGSPSRRRSTTTTTTTSTTTTTTAAPAQASSSWRVSWGSAMAWGYGTAADTTARQLAAVGVGGSAIRVRISNLYGNAPLMVGAATVGLSAGGPAVVPGTLQPLHFNGQAGTAVPVGANVYSDSVSMAVVSGQTLAVSLFVSSPDLVTVHPCCSKIVSYGSPNGGGDLTGSVTGAGLSIASPWDRWVDAVDVLQATGQGSIVVVGDSITDGFNATTDWASVLQQRVDMLPPSEQRAVVNEGISADTLISLPDDDEAKGGGPPGLARLADDVFDQSGVTEMVLFLGTNDLWFGANAQEVIAGYQQAVTAARQAGLRIVAVTLLPRSATSKEVWSEAQQAAIEQVDQWIRTSGAFDGVIDLAPVVADAYGGACVPTMLFPPYDSGDHLHPNAAGQTAMADAVDPAVLQLPPLPQVSPLLAVTPTSGCDAGSAA